MDELLELLIDERADESSMLSLLRDGFLDIDAVSEAEGYDITGEVMASPKSVVYYTAKYLQMLKERD